MKCGHTSETAHALAAHLAQVPGFSTLAKADQALLASSIVAMHEGIELQWFAQRDAVDLDRTLGLAKELIRYFIQTRTSTIG